MRSIGSRISAGFVAVLGLLLFVAWSGWQAGRTAETAADAMRDFGLVSQRSAELRTAVDALRDSHAAEGVVAVESAIDALGAAAQALDAVGGLDAAIAAFAEHFGRLVASEDAIAEARAEMVAAEDLLRRSTAEVAGAAADRARAAEKRRREQAALLDAASERLRTLDRLAVGALRLQRDVNRFAVTAETSDADAAATSLATLTARVAQTGDLALSADARALMPDLAKAAERTAGLFQRWLDIRRDPDALAPRVAAVEVRLLRMAEALTAVVAGMAAAERRTADAAAQTAELSRAEAVLARETNEAYRDRMVRLSELKTAVEAFAADPSPTTRGAVEARLDALRANGLAFGDEVLAAMAGYGEELRELAVAFEARDAARRGMGERLSLLTDRVEAERDALIERIGASGDESVRVTTVSSAAALVIGFVLAIGITRSITRPVQRLTGRMSALAGGDLETDLPDADRRDQIGAMARSVLVFRTTARETARLRREQEATLTRVTDLLKGARRVAGTVSEQSRRLDATAEALEGGASRQTEAVAEAAAAMDEMTATITASSDHSATTASIAREAADEARGSATAVEGAARSMSTIAERISVIREIARQTDLLALNAAVEAARAGVHGRGFAIVAAEVRRLAERSSQAADQIIALVDEASRMSQDAGRRIAGLVPRIERTSSLVETIEAGSAEQSAGAEQIAVALRDLERIATRNAGLSAEARTGATALAREADDLDRMIASTDGTSHGDREEARPVEARVA